MLNLIPLIAGMFSGLGRQSGGDPLQAQKEFLNQQQWRSAAENMLKVKTDTDNAIASGRIDTYTKSMNAGFQASKSIQF